MNSAASARVLVIGESLMDVVLTGGHESRHPGGSPMNVAVGLARLGVPTSLLTRFGTDTDGTAIAAHLATSGVEVLAQSISESATSTAVATIQSDDSAEYEFTIDWRIESFDGAQDFPWVHVGSISAFLQPGAATIERFLESVADQNVVSFDPNVRSAIIGNRSSARKRFERLARLSTVTKLSDEDAAWLYPDTCFDDVIEHVQSLGPRVVAVTLGARGSVIAAPDVNMWAQAVDVDVVDTIGAGDSYMAALIHQLLSMDFQSISANELGRAAKFSARAAAATCSRIGADPPSLEALAG